MSYTNIRMTMYGLLTAMEMDFRNIIRTQIIRDKNISEFIPPEIYSQLAIRAQRADEIDDLLEYLDFSGAYEIVSAQKNLTDPEMQKLIKQLTPFMQKITPIRNRVMHSRPLQFEDFTLVVELTEKILAAPAYLFPELSLVQEKLKTDPSYVPSAALVNDEFFYARCSHNLPLPDFDETGFLGRKDETRNIIKALKGPFPIVTIIGEGGVGKTAIALRVAYDLLDDSKSDFQAIVWVTSKTTRLTLADIVRIEGAIETSLGVFHDISETLVGNASNGSVDEILEYLNSFKILLILDNLETILDRSIKQFLGGLTGESKVLITSRVGLGELEYRFPLTAMSLDEAAQLLRVTARIRGVVQLSSLSNQILKSYCSRMKKNPGYIKWFVSAVQSGRRPEEVLANSTVFLDFCLSNVYGFLTEDARHVASIFLAVPGRHSQPVIAFLAELEGDKFQAAIQQLMITNILVMVTSHLSNNGETVYEMGELPRLYLAKKHPPKTDVAENFQRRKKEVLHVYERLSAEHSTDRYNPNTVSLRDKDDSAVAAYLLEALNSVRAQKYDEAFEYVDKAKILAPGYFEVYRVEAWAHTFAHNISVAAECWDTTIELEPKSPSLRFWYGGFLLRHMDDAPAAHDQFEYAVKLDGDAYQVICELGRTFMYLKRYAEAENAFQRVIDNSDSTLKYKRMASDGWLQTSLRNAQELSDLGKYDLAFDECKEAVRKFGDIPDSYLDARMIATLRKALPLLRSLLLHFEKTKKTKEIDDLYGKVCATLNKLEDNEFDVALPSSGLENPDIDFSIGSCHLGIVHNVQPDKGYGFIEAEGGARFFFHRSNLATDVLLSALFPRAKVEFIVGSGNKGLVADRISIMD